MSLAHYSVQFDPPALRELHKLPRTVFGPILSIIVDLSHDPRPVGHRQLTDSTALRVRWGAYRVLYTVAEDARVVTIYRVAHRSEVYH